MWNWCVKSLLSMHLFYVLIICTICVPDRSVWVSDSQQPFVEHRDMSPDVLYMREKQSLVIPCRVTHPNVTTTLVKVSAGNTHEMRSHHLDLHTHVPLCLSQPHHTEHILCTSSLVPVFFPSHVHTMPHPVISPAPDHSPHCSYLGSHYAVACVSICLCLSADMCESVCGYVCECWCLSAEWGACGQCYWGQRGAFRVLVVCMHVCFCMNACCCTDVVCLWNKTTSLCLNKRVNPPVKDAPFFLPERPAPTLSCWRCFYLWRQDMGSVVPLWPPASTISHISPSRILAANFPKLML